MSSVGELVVNLEADASGIKSGMAEGRAAVAQTTTVVLKQEQTWLEWSNQVLEAGEHAAGIAEKISKISHAAKLTTAELVNMASNVVTAASTLTIASVEMLKYLGVSAKYALTAGAVAAGTAAVVYQHQYLLSVLGLAVPIIAPITTAVGTLLTGYKLLSYGIREASEAYKASVDGTGEQISQYNQLHAALGRFDKQLDATAKNITQPFYDGAVAVQTYVESYSPFPSIASMLTTALDGAKGKLSETDLALRGAGVSIASALGPLSGLGAVMLNSVTAGDGLTGAIKSLSDGFDYVKVRATAVGVALAFGGSVSVEAAQSYWDQGKALSNLAAETEKAIAKQESLRSTFQEIAEIQKSAQTGSANSKELASVGKMTSLDEINAEILALQNRAAAAINAGKADKEWLAHFSSMINALEKQKQGIIDGTVVSEEKKRADQEARQNQDAVAQAIAAANAELTKLTYGEKEAKIAALDNKNATEEQIAQYRELLTAIDNKNKAKEEEKKLEEKVKREVESAKQANDKYQNTISSLADEIAVLTGNMTEQEARQRELQRGGMSAADAQDQARLEAEKKRLEEGKNGGDTGDKKVGAAMRGSAEAQSAIISAIQSGGNKQEKQQKTLEDIAENTAMAVDLYQRRQESGVMLVPGSLNA